MHLSCEVISSRAFFTFFFSDLDNVAEKVLIIINKFFFFFLVSVFVFFGYCTKTDTTLKWAVLLIAVLLHFSSSLK
jgi:hypothetical protein